MKIIMKGFAEIFGKVALMVMVATALFAGSIFLSTSVASACCDIPCPSCCPPPECSDDEYNAPEPITIFATKIVCNDESYLPNWGATQTPINGNTVSDFLNGNGQYCSVDPDWQFQWATQNTGNPGDNTGVAVVDWTTFLNSTQIDFSVVENLAHIWVREVWNNLYIPFTGATTTADESAEMYCHTDTINYDNYDRVDGPFVAGGTYYCVGFNALEEVNTPPIITLTQPTITIPFGSSFNPTDYATATDVEDGNITGSIVVSGDTVDTNTIGTYYVVYDVVDSEGLAAVTKTLEVIVEERTPNLCRVDLDVMIVMDRSGSMSSTFPPLYENRIGDAKIAANEFIGKLGSGDRSGLVSYSTVAVLNKILSSDHPATQSAIIALTATGATNVGDAIALANSEFPTNSQALKIEILLTDGKANKPYGSGSGENPADVAYAEQKAQEAADKGIKIFTIGLGSGVNTVMLQNIANVTGAQYYYAPTPADLEGIYNSIKWQLCQYGSISGCKYSTDPSGNNQSIMTGWNLTLEGNGYLQTQATDQYGCYQFSGLDAGSYTVSEAPDQGVDFLQTYPLNPVSYSVTLGEGDDVTGYDFGNYLPTCGNNIVDNDFGEQCDDNNTENGDGCSNQCLIEEEEPICSISGHKYNKTGLGLFGWLIGLAQGQSENYETVATTTTDVSGKYCFTGVDDGDYAVYEEMQNGWDIWKVMTGQTILNYFVDSFGVFTEVNISNGTTTEVDFYNQHPPVADAGVDQTVTVGTEVSFDGTASYDTDGIIVSYDWGFGDMATSTGATTTHTYTATGTYDVILTVTDDDNATGTDAVQITVEAGNNPVNPGDVIINELMWMGSATSTADEWIELKNASSSPTSLKDCYLTKFASATTTEKMLDIPDVQIAVGGFYLISNWNEIKSNINVEPNLVDTSVNLSNNNLKIELYCGETLIDTAGDGGVPLAGNNGVPKKSMQKCGDSWEDALVGGVDNNWDANATELGTPGLANVCEDENTPPTILGADDPLVFYVGDIETELELEALARLGVTATDTQDVILAGDIEITGLGSVSTSTVGTTTISYDVDDYGNPALSAQTVIREVRTVTQCSDGIDNDDDTMIDANDPGCWTDTSDPESYDPQDNDESYDGPEYPQCADELDNDGDGLIDYPNDPGCSSVDDDDEYNAPAPYCGDLTCSGSETCSTCSQDCGACSTGGGGGGGGWLLFPTTITITNEDVDYLGNGVAMVTWNTDISATSQVVYGDNSINKSDLGSAPKYGYDSVNEESLTLKTSHSMLITGLTHGTQYYFRPVSDKSGVAEVVGKEVTYTFVQVPPVCTYLLEYIKLGSANNPVEVKKLEQFLNDFEGENLAVNGIYEQADYEAVKRFQTKYREDILDPWNHTEATGYVYLTTKKKINELYCQREFPLTVSQEAEVATFKALLGGLQGSAVGTLEDTGALDVGSLVGAVDDGSDGGLADASSGTTAGDETEGPGLLASILGVLGFGDDEEGDATDSVSEEGPRNLASVIYSGVIDLATSFWFILLLIVTAIVLFFRIRGAERRE